MAARQPYRAVARREPGRASSRPAARRADVPAASTPDDAARRASRPSATRIEDLRILMAPMAINGQEAVGSMGTDTPLAVLSDQPQLLFNYFKQLFAQVTNPPIDPIREELVMSLEDDHRRRAEPLRRDARALPPARARRRRSSTNDELAQIKDARPGRARAPSRCRRSSRAGRAATGLEQALDELCAARAGGDRRAAPRSSSSPTAASTSEHAPIPSLLATAAVHHHLIREGTRTRCGLVVEIGRAARGACTSACSSATAPARSIPYLAFETLARHGRARASSRTSTADEAVEHYIKAVNKGLLKVMSKMGISTLQSYRGAQIFEAIGLNRELIDRYFTWTASRIEGVGLDVIARETRGAPRTTRTRCRPTLDGDLDPGGQYQWRRRGEYHMYNPETVAKLQHAVRAGNYEHVQGVHARSSNDESRAARARSAACSSSSRRRRSRSTRSSRRREIVKRFKTGAMSLGSISREAHENLAIAMNRIGGKSNTGEGGEDPARYMPDRERRSAPQRDQAGRLGPLRRHQLLPRQRRRAADQDGAGRQARRGRPAPRPQGRRVHRQDPLLDAGRRPDLAAAAPRHLLDRGPGAAHPRPEELQQPRAHQREAGRRGRRRHGRRRRRPRPRPTSC